MCSACSMTICDGEYSNFNNTPKIFKFVKPKTYGHGESTTHPTTLAEQSVGGRWYKGNASVEYGIDSNHLKMINLASHAKGVLEGDSVTNDVIQTVTGNAVTIAHSGIDHGTINETDDYYNGMTCSFFKSGEATIYGVIYDYNHDFDVSDSGTEDTHSTFYVWCGPNGDVTPATALSGETVADWSFQVGQNNGYLWDSDLHQDPRNRGVISADYGVTLMFDESTTSGDWMPESTVRYKFYHSTTFDAGSESPKQQESIPSQFTMYPRKIAAGVETHESVDEMYFCNPDSDSATDNTVCSAGSNMAVNFNLLVRLRADNTADGGGSNNFTIGSSNYDTTNQDAVDADGAYNFGKNVISTNQRIAGGRVYWSSSEDGFKSMNLLMDYDLDKGVRAIGSGSGAANVGGYTA